MTDDVYTPCPACGEEIPFYETVDDLKECPECHTHRDELFIIGGAVEKPESDVEVTVDV